MLLLRLFEYLNALPYIRRDRRTALGLRLFTKVSRLRICTLALETGGSRRAPQTANRARIRVWGRWSTAARKCVFRNPYQP